MLFLKRLLWVLVINLSGIESVYSLCHQSKEPGKLAHPCSLTRPYTIGCLTLIFHLDIPKIDNGQLQTQKHDKSIVGDPLVTLQKVQNCSLSSNSYFLLEITYWAKSCKVFFERLLSSTHPPTVHTCLVLWIKLKICNFLTMILLL
jgi:hypothetical protein